MREHLLHGVLFSNKETISQFHQETEKTKFIPGYRGLVELARRSGELRLLEADVVRERDEFDIVKGSGARVRHVPFIPGLHGVLMEEDPGRYVGVWFRAILSTGDEHVDFMSTAEVDAIRSRSTAADDGPWTTDWGMMARKTIVRRNMRFLPVSTALQRAFEIEEVAEAEAQRVTHPAVMPSRARVLARTVGPDAPEGEEVAPAATPEPVAAPEPSVAATDGFDEVWEELDSK